MIYADLRERIIANSVLAHEGAGNVVDGELCWLWTGTTNSQGRPRLCIRKKTGKRKGQPVQQLAYRVVVKEWTGRAPGGRVVKHKCDNPLCVNPTHLVAGTQASNMRECVARGRHRTPFGATAA